MVVMVAMVAMVAADVMIKNTVVVSSSGGSGGSCDADGDDDDDGDVTMVGFVLAPFAAVADVSSLRQLEQQAKTRIRGCGRWSNGMGDSSCSMSRLKTSQQHTPMRDDVA